MAPHSSTLAWKISWTEEPGRLQSMGSLKIPMVLPEIGIERILLETDSPYLAPVPNRGKRNESANIPHICRCVASHIGVSENECSQITDLNAHALFNI